MEFSAWSWASNFRLHEAACLIAGVVPISKRNPATDELPSQARPPLIKLVGAYYEWFLQAKNPERPKNIALEGVPNEDGSPPPFPDLKEVSGEIVSREAIHRFVSLMAEHGFKSCYDFGPIGKAGPPHEVGHQTQAATPVSVSSIEPTPAPQHVLVGRPGCTAPPPASRHTRTGWKEGPAFNYVAEQFAQHGPFRAKALIASLKKNTGPGSPFEVRGGVLTVRATGQGVQDKTIENSMVDIRHRAKELGALKT